MIRTDFRMEDRSEDLIQRCSKAGQKAYKKAGKEIVKEIKTGIAVRTGALRTSISSKVTVMDGVPILDVGAKKKVKGKTAHHAHLVEDGTGYRVRKNGKSTGSMPKKPFLKSKKTTIQNIMEKTIKEEMAKLGDK